MMNNIQQYIGLQRNQSCAKYTVKEFVCQLCYNIADKMWYNGWHTIIGLADNYWAGLLTPEIIVILFTQALPTCSVLADNYWAPECTKITLVV